MKSSIVADPPLFAINDLHKSYGGSASWLHPRKTITHALAGIDLEIPAGTRLGIVGESGSGKSTLARILVGLTQASSGCVRFTGKPLADCLRRPRDFYRQVQFVFQNSAAALNPRKSIRATFHRHLHSLCPELDPASARERIKSVCDSVMLPQSLLDCHPHALSGGQAQRANIARALLSSPRAIIMDEPVSALDVSVQARVLTLLQNLARSNTFSMVFISHDLAVIDFLCDQLCVIHNGRIVESGPTHAILNNPANPYTKTLLTSSVRNGNDSIKGHI